MLKMVTGEGITLTPDYMFLLDGKNITAAFSSRLISLTLTDNRGFVADQLEVMLDDSDGQIELPQRGLAFAFYLGWKGTDSVLIGKGTFTVDEVTHQGAPDVVKIVARSADLRGDFNKVRDDSWHDQTLGAIFTAIAKKNKLGVSLEPSLAAIHIPHIDQTQESDAVFLTRIAKYNGGEMTVKGGKLYLVKPGKGVNAKGEILPEITLRRQDGDKHGFKISDRDAYTGVTAKWLNTKTPQSQDAAVTLQRKNKTQHGTSTQHPNAVSQPKSGSTQKANDGQYMAGSADNVFTMTKIFASEAQAKRAADAMWNELQRNVAKFSLSLALGNPQLCPDMPVRLSGFKSVIDQQRWRVTTVTHAINDTGYTSSVNCELDISEAKYDT